MMKSRRLYHHWPRIGGVALVCLALLGGALILKRHAIGLWRDMQVDRKSQIKVTAVNSHKILASTAIDGTLQPSASVPSLATAVAHQSKVPYEIRLAVIHGSPKTLSVEQLHLIRIFIAESRLPAGLTAGEVHALKSEALILLGQQKEYKSALVVFLHQLIDDEGQDPVVRDYALQELGGINTEREQGSRHWNIAEGSDSDLAATALLHLLAFEREGQLSSSEEVRLAVCALKLAEDPAKPETSRATALQVCGQLKFSKARSIAYIL